MLYLQPQPHPPPAETIIDHEIHWIKELKNLGDELSDVLFVIICLANQTGIDLEKSFYQNLNNKTRRDNKRHLSNKKLKS